MTFDRQQLIDGLQALTGGQNPARWLVAFSGGVDSTVLLHALASSTSDSDIVAIHIDHGLHADSAEWQKHCETFAADLGVGFVSRKVSVEDKSTQGPEAAAREERYAALLQFVQSDDILLSAHHEDDQAETLLLNLMRGSGPAGLAGIGQRHPFGRGQLLRPLLGVSNDAIEAYARQHSLSWIEDPSNANTRFDRNFLRKDVMPTLAARWPAVTNRLRRSAELMSEASELMNDLADIDLQSLGSPTKLSISALQSLSPARQRNVLRHAVRLAGLPPPPATRLYQIIHELLPARSDAQPLVSWAGVEVRRFQDELHILPPLPEANDTSPGTLFPGESGLSLGSAMGSLMLVDTAAKGIDPVLAKQGLIIRYRQGGEAMRIERDGPTKKLKKLLQEHSVLPWMRPRLPLLYAGDQLVAVANLWVETACTASPGLAVEWRDCPPAFQIVAL